MLIIAAPLLLAAATVPQPPGAEALLRDCLAKYSSMNSFSAHCTLTGNEMPSVSIEQDFKYQKPNKVLINTQMSAMGRNTDFKIACDGSSFIMSSSTDKEVITDKAPDSLADSKNPFLQSPTFSGILKFFGPYDSLVDTSKGAPVAGSEETTKDGQKAMHVAFQGKNVGKTDVLIGEDSKLIYAITYTGESGGGIKQQVSNITVDPPLEASVFDATPPKDAKVQTMADLRAAQEKAEVSQDQPPVPLGKPAPDIKVFSLANGQPMKLSSLKGKVVLIDFWATWCPPCRESLPHTEDIFKKYSSHNVQVVTISDEDAPTIRKFITAQKYTFPLFRDADGTASKAYGITGIPTVVVVDAKGNLSAFLVGLRDEDVLVDALKKAGAN